MLVNRVANDNANATTTAQMLIIRDTLNFWAKTEPNTEISNN